MEREEEWERGGSSSNFVPRLLASTVMKRKGQKREKKTIDYCLSIFISLNWIIHRFSSLLNRTGL